MHEAVAKTQRAEERLKFCWVLSVDVCAEF